MINIIKRLPIEMPRINKDSINKDINNKKEAYKEFNVYLNANKLQTVNTFILNIKGE